MKSSVKNIIKTIFVLAVLYFVGRQISRNWDDVVTYDWNFDFGWFALAVALHLLTLAGFSKVWCLLVRGFGYEVPFKYGFKISYITNLGRYIPGKIWPIFGMVHYARQVKMSEESAVTSWILAQVFALPSAFLVAFTGTLLFPRLLTVGLGESQQWLMIPLTAGSLLVSLMLILFPHQSLILVSLLLRILKRPPLKFDLRSRLAWQIYLGYVICWILYGLSFWIFLKAVLPDPKIGMPEAATAFILAYQLGYVAIIAPGGLGVRELVLTGALAPYVGPISGGIAVVTRFWNLIVEISAALVAVSIRMQKREALDGEEKTDR